MNTCGVYFIHYEIFLSILYVIIPKINKHIFVSRKLHIPITKQYLFVLLIKHNPTNNFSMISYMSSNIAQNTLAVTNTNTEI